jgi:hypothetical protein
MTGVGGQGTVLASKVLAQTALNAGYFVRTSETIGMAQRGGCVTSHIRFGDDCASPAVPQGCADVIVGFEPSEAVRGSVYVKPHGIILVNTKAIKPITSSLTGQEFHTDEMLAYLRTRSSRVIAVNGEALYTLAGNPRTLNIILLGAGLAEGAFPFTRAAMVAAMRQVLPEKLWAINEKALDLGLSYLQYQ